MKVSRRGLIVASAGLLTATTARAADAPPGLVSHSARPISTGPGLAQDVILNLYRPVVAVTFANATTGVTVRVFDNLEQTTYTYIASTGSGGDSLVFGEAFPHAPAPKVPPPSGAFSRLVTITATDKAGAPVLIYPVGLDVFGVNFRRSPGGIPAPNSEPPYDAMVTVTIGDP